MWIRFVFKVNESVKLNMLNCHENVIMRIKKQASRFYYAKHIFLVYFHWPEIKMFLWDPVRSEFSPIYAHGVTFRYKQTSEVPLWWFGFIDSESFNCTNSESVTHAANDSLAQWVNLSVCKWFSESFNCTNSESVTHAANDSLAQWVNLSVCKWFSESLCSCSVVGPHRVCVLFW